MHPAAAPDATHRHPVHAQGTRPTAMPGRGTPPDAATPEPARRGAIPPDTTAPAPASACAGAPASPANVTAASAADPISGEPPDTAIPRYRGSIAADPVHGLLDRLADYLSPQFVSDPADLPVARIMAGRTMASYQPETQADFINAARTIAFSLSALATLSHAAAHDMPPARHLRYLGKAIALNRCADQSERAMDRRRHYLRTKSPQTPAGLLVAQQAEPLPVAELTAAEAAIQTAVNAAVADYVTTRAPAQPAAEPAHAPPPTAPSKTARLPAVVETTIVPDQASDQIPANAAAASPAHADGSMSGGPKRDPITPALPAHPRAADPGVPSAAISATPCRFAAAADMSAGLRAAPAAIAPSIAPSIALGASHRSASPPGAQAMLQATRPTADRATLRSSHAS